jgi:hypothetical protein
MHNLCKLIVAAVAKHVARNIVVFLGGKFLLETLQFLLVVMSYKEKNPISLL